MNFTSVDAKGVEKYKANLTEILNAKPDISLEDLLNSMGDIDKDKVAEEYLKQNLLSMENQLLTKHLIINLKN